jgi:hypothetical protein
MNKIKQNKFKEAIKNNDIKIVNSLLYDSDVDVAEGDDFFIRFACDLGYTDIVKLLLSNPKINPSNHYQWSILNAVEKGHFDIVVLLLKDSRMDTSDFFDTCIEYSSRNKDYKTFNLIWEYHKINKKNCSEDLQTYEQLKKNNTWNKINDF